MRFIFFFAAFFLMLCHGAAAKDARDYTDFSSIPVQHDGRIKPLSSFAKNLLYTYSGHDKIKDMDAQSWLAMSLFNPSDAIQTPVFRIFRPDIIGLATKDSPYFSLADIAPKLQERMNLINTFAQIKPADLSRDQAEILRIKDNAESYIQLLRSFSFLLPLQLSLPPELIKDWNIDTTKPFSLEEYKKIEARVMAHVKAIVIKKGEDLKKYTPEEMAVAGFSFEMKILESGGDGNNFLRIFPSINSQEWFSPWAITSQGQSSPQSTAYMALWHGMAQAYLENDVAAWAQKSKDANAFSSHFAGTQKIPFEQIYNKLHPLGFALIFYALAFVAYIIAGTQSKSQWMMLSMLSFAGGVLMNFLAVVLRIIILVRPPVGTLYESILFVALVCAMGCAAMEYKKRDGFGLMAGSLAGTLLLFIASSLADGDTLKVLTAVLNTNFWLATHVLCITMGYAWCLVVSVLAHLWLWKYFKNANPETLKKPIQTFTLLSLLFTAVGTILGGIWADQSWGRFWGWDPKENGALLIVLWIIWILHGQISGMINRLQVMMALAALSIVVSLAWFGVNLLNVGLHSYGFISGMAYSLAGFIALEMLLIGALGYMGRQRNESRA